MVEITRTISLKLNPTPEQAGILNGTMQAYCNALNYASNVAHEMGNCRNYAALHHKVYYEMRQRFGLLSQMACSVERQVAATYSSMRASRNGSGKAIFNFKGGITLQGGERGRDFRLILKKKLVSLSTIKGRQKVAFLCGDFQRQYLAEGWQIGSATLLKRRGIFYLNVALKTDVAVCLPNEACAVIGVDIGQNYLAVASAPDDKTIFCGGSKVRHRKHHYRRARKGLQAKGTKSAKRTLKRLSGREARFQKDANHIVSKKIVEFASQYDRPVIVLEDLKGIRENGKRRKKDKADFHSWAFYQLRQFITYKATALGIPTVEVDPKNTSKTCSRCGQLSARNRHDFSCSCGFRLHSDLNASRNLALRFIVHRQLQVGGDGPLSAGPEVLPNEAKTVPGRDCG